MFLVHSSFFGNMSLILLEAIYLSPISGSIHVNFFPTVRPSLFCPFTSQDVAPSFLLSTYRAYPLVSISFQSTDAHLPPSYASSRPLGTHLCVYFPFPIIPQFLVQYQLRVAQLGNLRGCKYVFPVKYSASHNCPLSLISHPFVLFYLHFPQGRAGTAWEPLQPISMCFPL
jgi:hypothetical protein